MNSFETFNVTREEGSLKNGIRVILFKRAGSPITTSAVLTSGSKHDPDSIPGLSHFLEHMITNGSEQFRSKDLLAEHIESVGGIYGARTGQDLMFVETEVSDKNDYERVVDIFNATLCNSLMDRKVFENEKKVVIKEIQKNNSNPTQVLKKTIRKLSFSKTPFEHEVLGDENSISNLQYENALTEHKKLFDKSRIIFVCAGDISIGELVNHLNTLSFLEGNVFKTPDERLSISYDKNILATFFDAPQTHISFGIPAPESFTKESLHLNILGTVLAGGRNARLTKRLRYEKGLVYGIGFNKYGGQTFGSWNIITDTTDDKVQEVVNEIIEELKEIQKNGITEKELEFVKNKRIKSLKRSMQTSTDWVNFHATAEVFSTKPYTVDTFVEDVEKTTIEDIKKVINTYLAPDKWQLALCGKTKEESIKINW